MTKIRIDNQIESASASGYKVIGKKDGETDWTGQDPKQVSPTTWIADDAGIYENIPGQFEIPSLPYAKDVDTVFSRGGKVFKYNAGGGYFELVFNSVVQVIEASETDIATFAANSDNYTFQTGDFIAIPDGGGGYNLFIYNGGTKTDTNSYLPLDINQVNWSQVNNTPTTLAGYGITDAATSAQGALADTAIQPGDNISGLNNDSGYLTETTHDNLPQDNPHGVTKAQVGLGNVDNTSDADKPVSTAQGQAINQAEADAKQYTDDEINALNLGSASQADVGDFIASTEKGAANGVTPLGSDLKVPTQYLPPIAISEVIEATETDIASFAANSASYTFQTGDVIIIDDGSGNLQHYQYKGGAKTDVNEYSLINATQVDWSNVTGKPTFGSAALANTGDFATANQGIKADTAIQPNNPALKYIEVAVAASNASDTAKSKSKYVCDGVDDHVEINLAINELALNGGGQLYLPKGDYVITDQIIVKDKCELIGSGWGTIIKLADGVNFGTLVPNNPYALIRNESVGDSIKIKDLRVNGNGSNNSSGRYHGVFIVGGDDCMVSNLDVYGANGLPGGVGICVSSGNRVSVVDSFTHHNSRNGIATTNNPLGFVISNNVSTKNSESGIHTSTGEGVVSGNVCINNNTDGIQCTNAAQTTYIGNTCNNNGWAGITSNGGHKVIIGNSVHRNGRQGIYLDATGDGISNVQIIGNKITRNGETAIEGIKCLDIIISGNNIEDGGPSVDYGIYFRNYNLPGSFVITNNIINRGTIKSIKFENGYDNIIISSNVISNGIEYDVGAANVQEGLNLM